MGSRKGTEGRVFADNIVVITAVAAVALPSVAAIGESSDGFVDTGSESRLHSEPRDVAASYSNADAQPLPEWLVRGTFNLDDHEAGAARGGDASGGFWKSPNAVDADNGYSNGHKLGLAYDPDVETPEATPGFWERVRGAGSTLVDGFKTTMRAGRNMSDELGNLLNPLSPVIAMAQGAHQGGLDGALAAFDADIDRKQQNVRAMWDRGFEMGRSLVTLGDAASRNFNPYDVRFQREMVTDPLTFLNNRAGLAAAGGNMALDFGDWSRRLQYGTPDERAAAIEEAKHNPILQDYAELITSCANRDRSACSALNFDLLVEAGTYGLGKSLKAGNMVDDFGRVTDDAVELADESGRPGQVVDLVDDTPELADTPYGPTLEEGLSIEQLEKFDAARSDLFYARYDSSKALIQAVGESDGYAKAMATLNRLQNEANMRSSALARVLSDGLRAPAARELETLLGAGKLDEARTFAYELAQTHSDGFVSDALRQAGAENLILPSHGPAKPEVLVTWNQHPLEKLPATSTSAPEEFISRFEPYRNGLDEALKFMNDRSRVLDNMDALDAEVRALADEWDQTGRTYAAEEPLINVLEAWEKRYGFGDAVKIADNQGNTADGLTFSEALQAGRPIDDMPLGPFRHGRDTHRIQWNVLLREYEKNPALFADAQGNIPSPVDLYKATGLPTADNLVWPQASVTGQSAKGVWAQIFDSFHANFTMPEHFTHELTYTYPELAKRWR